MLFNEGSSTHPFNVVINEIGEVMHKDYNSFNDYTERKKKEKHLTILMLRE